MRIISDQKDYYDCIQATGQDQSLVYVRTPKEVENHGIRPPICHAAFYTGSAFTIEQFVIGFCGKIYPLLKITDNGNKHSKCCFNVDETDKFFSGVFTPKQLSIYHTKWLGRRFWYLGIPRHREIAEYFEKFKQFTDRYCEYFIREQCPVFVIIIKRRSEKMIHNCLLRPYEFFRLFDPFRAFQEIAMFMSNLAVPQKPMPIIPDELKIQSKGFDKWSFRRPPIGL